MGDCITWICHICFRLSVGGVFTYIMKIYENVDRSKYQFAFIVQRDFKYGYDSVIENMGGKIFYVTELLKNKKKYMDDLNKIFKEHPEFSIIHCHMNYYNYYPLLVAKNNKIPVRISHNHTAIDHYSFKTKIKYYIFRLLIRKKATHQVACSYKAGYDLYKKEFVTSFV